MNKIKATSPNKRLRKMDLRGKLFGCHCAIVQKQRETLYLILSVMNSQIILAPYRKMTDIPESNH